MLARRHLRGAVDDARVEAGQPCAVQAKAGRRAACARQLPFVTHEPSKRRPGHVMQHHAVFRRGAARPCLAPCGTGR